MKNNAYYILLPILSKYVKLDFRDNIDNVFIGVTRIYVKYVFEDNERFLSFENKLFNNEYFDGYDDVDQFTYYKFIIPEEMKNIIDLFKRNSLSELDSKDKEIIISFNRLMRVGSAKLNSIKYSLTLDEDEQKKILKNTLFKDESFGKMGMQQSDKFDFFSSINLDNIEKAIGYFNLKN